MTSPELLFPAWLLAIPPALWLLIVFCRSYRRRSMWSEYCEPRLIALLNTGTTTIGRNSLLIVFALLIILSLLALAGPSWQQRDYPLLESSASRVLVLDLSLSMQVEDVKPSRMELALQISRQYLESGFEGETALVVFAGSAFTVSPLTSDASTLLEFIEALGPSTMPLEGDRLDLALEKANQLLSGSITQNGQITVVTDGISDFERAKRIAEQSRQLGNQVSIVAIGSRQGGPLKSSEGGLERNAAGEFIIARPNLHQLRSLSQLGNGKFLHIDNGSPGIDKVPGAKVSGKVVDIDKLGLESVSLAENGGFWLVWLALPLTLLLFRRNMLWLVLVAAVTPEGRNFYAMDWNTLWMNDEQKAYSAYRQGDFARVERLSKNPRLLGSALYRQEKFAQAGQRFSQQENAAALYNLGNTLSHRGLLQEALASYRRALEIDPEYKDASFNYDLIYAYLQKQQAAGAESTDDDESFQQSGDQIEDFNSRSRPGQAQEAVDFSEEIEQAGLGDSSKSGHTDLTDDEEISESDLRLQQFLKNLESDGFSPDRESIMLWVESIGSDPAELFKRKFLRDHLRNQRQQR